MFQNIRKQKEHARKVGFAQGYAQARQDMGLPPAPAPDAPAPAPAVSETVTVRRMLEAIERFGVVGDGGVKIRSETLAVLRFMVQGADDADTPAGR